MAIFFGFLLLVLGGLSFRCWSRRHRRQQLLNSGLSHQQGVLVERHVPLVRRLPPQLREEFEGKMRLFLDQVRFLGGEGLEVSEEMRVSIAAQACLLIVNNDLWYDNLRTIIVYPSAFKSNQSRQSGFVVTEQQIVRTGESWNRGPVVLSWAHSRLGAMNDTDGHNVVLHEFAHQIDDMSGATNGVPLLGREQSFAEWERVFLNAYDDHVRALESGRKTLIDPYGAEGHEEFFAVSVEVFFERPVALRQDQPEVYAQLARLFRLDPARWQ